MKHDKKNAPNQPSSHAVSNQPSSHAAKPWRTLLARELSSLYQSPVAWIVTVLFLVFSGFLFFPTFFLVNRAEMRNFFSLLPIMFSFFIPALTMRLLAEEQRSGSLETLLTLPVKTTDVVYAKFVSVVVFVAGMLGFSLVYVLSISVIGKPDFGPIIGGYLGSIFLVAAYTAIGIFASSVTKNQIVAFFVGFALCISLSFIHQFSIFLPASIVSPLEFLGTTSHFNAIARGIIDTRDLIYFISLTALFLGLTIKNVGNRRTA